MKESVFATAAATPHETSIAAAKRLGQQTGLVVDLPEDQLDMVTGGQSSLFKFGENSFKYQQQNSTQNNFGGNSGGVQFQFYGT